MSIYVHFEEHLKHPLQNATEIVALRPGTWAHKSVLLFESLDDFFQVDLTIVQSKELAGICQLKTCVKWDRWSVGSYCGVFSLTRLPLGCTVAISSKLRLNLSSEMWKKRCGKREPVEIGPLKIC